MRVLTSQYTRYPSAFIHSTVASCILASTILYMVPTPLTIKYSTICIYVLAFSMALKYMPPHTLIRVAINVGHYTVSTWFARATQQADVFVPILKSCLHRTARPALHPGTLKTLPVMIHYTLAVINSMPLPFSLQYSTVRVGCFTPTAAVVTPRSLTPLVFITAGVCHCAAAMSILVFYLTNVIVTVPIK